MKVVEEAYDDYIINFHSDTGKVTMTAEFRYGKSPYWKTTWFKENGQNKYKIMEYPSNKRLKHAEVQFRLYLLHPEYKTFRINFKNCLERDKFLDSLSKDDKPYVMYDASHDQIFSVNLPNTRKETELVAALEEFFYEDFDPDKAKCKFEKDILDVVKLCYTWDVERKKHGLVAEVYRRLKSYYRMIKFGKKKSKPVPIDELADPNEGEPLDYMTVYNTIKKLRRTGGDESINNSDEAQ